MEKFKEIQSAKAAELAKEAEQQRKLKNLPATRPNLSAAGITNRRTNSFEEDLGRTNPFEEGDGGFSFTSDVGTNPFLEDIKAASAAATALSYGGNPFEQQSSSLGKFGIFVQKTPYCGSCVSVMAHRHSETGKELHHSKRRLNGASSSPYRLLKQKLFSMVAAMGAGVVRGRNCKKRAELRIAQ